MSTSLEPRLRRVESFPVNQADGQVMFALRDPEGFSGAIVLPYAAAVLVSLMDGTRGRWPTSKRRSAASAARPWHWPTSKTWYASWTRAFCSITIAFARAGKWKSSADLNSQARPAAHAGGVDAGEPDELRAPARRVVHRRHGSRRSEGRRPSATGLCGVLSPHIDLHRGGPAFAWAYKHIVEETDADVFVIFGTAHNPMRNLFSVTRKHFETPLGTVETDRAFVSQLAAKLASARGGQELNLFADESAHRQEHSIEFQAVFLQYLLGDRRPFKIVPVLTGSFHEFVAGNRSPTDSAQVSAFVTAMRQTAAHHGGKICYISGGDLAHIGQRFGDRAFLDAARLKDQAENDRELLAAACRCDSDAFFRHVASQQDRNRICGLSPTYTMLEVMRPAGELLRYDQAVELDGTACVSFASLAFYRQ